jgi:REP element-mobilizing transposase RayT
VPELRRFLLEGQCYHTVSTTRERQPTFADPVAAEVVIRCLDHVREDKAFVLAFALMPDHLHLVLVPRNPFTLPQVMQSVKGYSSRIINQQRERHGRIWQAGYCDRVIRTEEHLRQAVDYVHLNPVTAGLAERPEAYPLSSAHPSIQTDIEAWLGAPAPRLESLGYG